jgi:hypothetical protein
MRHSDIGTIFYFHWKLIAIFTKVRQFRVVKAQTVFYSKSMIWSAYLTKKNITNTWHKERSNH